MKRVRFLASLLGLACLSTMCAQLVAPPDLDWVSVPSSASVGQTVSVGAGGHANLSDNSDGNDWNDTEAVLAIIAIYVQRPGQSDWTLLTGWLDPWRTPADQWTSFTVNDGGTHYVKFLIMDGRPWFTPEYVYAIDIPNPAPGITSQLSVSANQGYNTSYTITATNNPTSYGASNLPAGLSLDPSTGVISGRVTAWTSTVNSTITATNAAGTDSKTLTWNITGAVITGSSSVSPATIALGSAVTLTRAGWANFGIAWTENVIWKPNGQAEVLGNMQPGSMSYTPTALGTYWYQVRIVDNSAYNYADQWISFSVVDGTPPSVPAGLAASNVTINSFTLSWNASSDDVGVTAYEVFRNGSSLGTTSTLSMDVTGLSIGTTYAMTVRARDAAGNWSGQSATLNVTTAADTSAPSVPAGLAASSITSSSFTLSWGASNDNVGVTAYEVFRSGTSLGTTSSLSMNVTGLAPSTTYGMTVRARDAAGNWSAQSVALNVSTAADTAAPSVPAGLSASAITVSSFTFSWGASNDNVGVTAYEVFRNGISLGTTAGLNMGIGGMSSSTTYGMTVRARDAAGNWSAQSSSLNVTTAADTTAPSVPAGVGQSAGGSYSFSLTWNASSDNIGVTAYEVRRDGTSLGTTSALTMNVPDLAPNTVYGMTVRARDAAGNWSDWSAATNVTTAASFEVFTPL